MQKKYTHMKPTRIIVISFLLIILFGTLLLTLPISSKSREFTPPLDAFFTATSATCVTGLIVHDTGTYWSIFGQCVIILMIQLGGLGLVTFATFFNFALGKRL
ncbi:MAG TPA: Trk family potassium uptake protein, partial [Clostridiales bacterium]|nr:Trk family potassium uptake protein [Clostridiales bacterium]